MNIQPNDKNVVNLLWTGGWDSTYRLIDLAYVKKVKVQPYYIIDYERKSTFMELKTIQKIKGMIYRLNEQAYDRILPLIIVPRFDITEQKDITEKFEKLKQRDHLGGQYDWIARFACQFGLDDLELSIEYSENHPSAGSRFIQGNTIKIESNKIGNYYILDDESKKTALSLFRFFHFPLLDMSKAQMKREAEQLDFDGILEETWFCHSPLGTTLCGVCPACRGVIEDKMEYRLPGGALSRYRLRKYILWTNDKFDNVKPYIKLKRLIRNLFP